MAIQHERGWVDNDSLRELAAARNVPLYRLEGLVSFYPHFRRIPPPERVVRVCRDVCCCMADGEQLADSLRQQETPGVEIVAVSCLGRCDAAPAYSINDDPQPAVQEHADLRVLPRAAQRADGPTSQWRVDPYANAADRYSTISRCLATEDLSEHCISRLEESKLRGMGGAGFPTGLKWKLVAGEVARPKYVVCNADESEPGTFKDREILCQLPHLIIEGMILAGLTIGAERGIIYLRHEYEPERVKLQSAIDEAYELGVLGDDICGSGRVFDLEVFVSPGGYILGEETALLEALEDKRGEPRNKPPYPGTHGLWGKPTLINNVETFALATAIIHHGAAWWHEQGKGDFSGLKFTAISGDVTAPGVFEVPMGTTVAELIELAGGVVGELRAFLPGGASSKFLTAAEVRTPLDFDAVKAAGSMLGTGAVIVMNESRDLFQLATNLVTFFRNESCGKCVPCRLGSDHAVRMLEQPSPPDQLQQELAELHFTLEQTSICGLGQVALAPILSMLERFPDDLPD